MNDTNLSQPEDSMREYLSKVSYNQSNLILALAVILLGVDLVLTLVHSLQELKGVNAPLWRYFGAIIGVQIPDWLGFPVFFVLLTVVLWAVGLAGIIGYVPFLEKERRDKWAIAAVGVLIGARISDGIFSHILLWYLGYRPNPGLASIPYYFAEALFLIILFFPGLKRHWGWATAGFAIGFFFFLLVLPSLQLIRQILLLLGFESFCPEPWLSGESSPEWARLLEKP
jgi:hypothetical protein